MEWSSVDNSTLGINGPEGPSLNSFSTHLDLDAMTGSKKFDPKKDIPDLKGKVAVVTGGK